MSQIISDDFNRADGALGANWTQLTSIDGLVVSSNTAANDGGSVAAQGHVIFTGASWTGGNDQYAEVSLTAGHVNMDYGPSIRGTGASYAALATYQASVNDNDNVALPGSMLVAIYKRTGGTTTSLASGTFTISVADVIRIEAQGTTIRIKQNGTQILSASDATVTTGSPGLRTFRTAVRAIGDIKMDNFIAGDFSSGVWFRPARRRPFPFKAGSPPPHI